MTPPALPPETLAALAAAARELAPSGFDVEVGVYEEGLQVVVGHKPRGPAYGYGRRLDDFGPAPNATALATHAASAVPRCVEGIMSEVLRPLRVARDAAREREYRTQGKYACAPTRGNLQLYSDARYAYQKAQRELEEESLRTFGVKP